MTDNNRIGVGLVQMTCRLGDKTTNLARAESLLSELAGRAQVACLPEMFNTGYNLDVLGEAILDLAETVPGETTTQLGTLARRLDLAIIASLVERDSAITGLIYDATVLLNREGELVGCYRKSHLYPAENSFFCPGNTLPVFDLDGLKVGVAICFEHAFPHIFTTLALRGAQVIFNPSAVPVGYGYLQDLRTRARAQDNQVFVAAVNHVGAEGGVTYCGCSQVADPRGEVVAMASDNAEMAVVAELSFDLILDQRWQEPIFRGFRPELYQNAP